MFRRLKRSCPLLALILFGAMFVSTAAAAPPHADVLPDTTRGHVASLDLDRLDDHWSKTQVGQLMADPVMAAFKEDLKRQFNEKMEQATQRLGLTWDDVRAMAGGPVSASIIREENGPTVLAVLIDVTGKEQEVATRLADIYKRLTDSGAKRRNPLAVGDTELTVFDLPPRAGLSDDRRQSAFFQKDNLLAAVAHVPTARDMIARFSGQPTGNLANLPAYVAVVNRCRAAADGLEPDLHWYVEPIAYVEAMRAADPDYKREGRDMLKVLKNQGFQAIRGLGGFVNFNAAGGPYEMLHRTAIHAPEPYELAMRMMVFPNSEEFTPFDWVPRDVATHATVHCDVPNAFERFSTMFDELFGEGVEGTFESTLDSIRDDPFGTRIDMRKDLVAHLANRVTIITDYELPITTTSERSLYAIQTTNQESLAATIKKMMDADRTMREIAFEGHVIWEQVEDDEAVPELKIDHPLPNIRGGRPKPKRLIERGEDERLLSSSVVTVAHGHLMAATHLDILKKVLRQKDPHERLIHDFDFQVVQEELGKLGTEANCARIFSRTDEEYRPSYELLRMGKMPEAETMLARVLNSVLGVKKGEIREPKIDGSELPEFEAIRRYFGPGGMVVSSEENGWFAVGFTLNKETPRAAMVD